MVYSGPMFSVVVPVTSGEALPALMACLAAQTCGADGFECIVVSALPLTHGLQTAFRLKQVLTSRPCGLAEARNRGAQLSEGEHVVFLAETERPLPGWIAAFAQALLNPAIAVVSGAHAGALFLSGHEDEVVKVCEEHPESILCSLALTGSNVAVRRSLLVRTRGFDVHLPTLLDWELGVQLWELGAGFAFAPDAQPRPGELQRRPEHAEFVNFFFKQPYTLLYLAYLWAHSHCADKRLPRQPIIETLSTLAESAERCAFEDFASKEYRGYGRPLPAEAQHPQRELAAYYHDCTGVPVPEITGYLDQGRSRGLFCQVREGTVYFDNYHTTNWLQGRTLLHTFRLRHHYHGFDHPTPRQRNLGASALTVLRVKGSYQVQVPREALSNVSLANATITLPLPVEHRAQRLIGFSSEGPLDLLPYRNQEIGLLARIPLDAFEGSHVELGYSFECEVSEARPDSIEGAAAPLEADLKPIYPPKTLQKARVALERLDFPPGANPDDQAQIIYGWVLEQHIVESPLPDLMILDGGFGTCVAFTRLFISLCRLKGIAAREQCGGFFTNTDGNTGQMVSRGLSPLTHTWAEYFSPLKGWVPVEFMPWGYTDRAMTAHNVEDAQLRARILTGSRGWDTYYFGGNDPYRIYVSPQANKAPSFPIIPGNPAGLQRILAQTRHVICFEF